MKYRSQGQRPILPQRTLHYLKEGAPEGQRNAELFDAACQFRDAGIPPDVAEPQLIARAMADGLSEAEARTTIRSVFGHAPRKPVQPGTGSAQSHPAPASAPQSPPAGPRFTPEPIPLPEPIGGGFLLLLDACFKPDEYVALAPAKEQDGEIVPSRGVTLTAAEWRARVEKKGGIDRCFSTKHGLFVRVNPVCKDGARNEDVVAFRHVLVEFDKDAAGADIPKPLQFGTIISSGLPVAAVIDSGGKSVHGWVRVDAPNPAEYQRRVDMVWDRLKGLHHDTKNKNPSRLSRCPDGWRTVNGEVRQQRLLAVNLGAKTWAEWEAAHSADSLPKIVSAAEFMAVPRPEPPQLIAGVLHQGCKMIIGGASKARKSWTLIDMALSVSTGTRWWGFPTQQGRALYVNFELPEFAFQHRISVIAAAKGVTDFSNCDLWNLRGFATDFSVLIPKILARIKECRYALIVLDPVYKGLGKRDENKAGDIASLCNEIEQLAVQSGAAVVFGAHYSKGNQAGKEAIDRIGGSGVFARDPDVILTMTPHEEKEAYVVDLTLRALPQMEPFVVRWQGVTFARDDSADPSRLRAAKNAPAPKTSKATYRVGSAAKKYGAAIEAMPPLKHDRDPSLSQVVAYIGDAVAKIDGDCALDEALRIYKCLSVMKKGPIIFDRSTRLWRGSKYVS